MEPRQRRSGARALVNDALEMPPLLLIHAGSALAAPSGHLPREGTAIYIKRRGRHHHFSFLIFHASEAFI